MLMPEHYSEEALRQWGRNENVARIRDLREHPEHARARAGLRRNYASLTAAQAAWAVGQAQAECRCPECGKSTVPAGDGGDSYNCACPETQNEIPKTGV